MSKRKEETNICSEPEIFQVESWTQLTSSHLILIFIDEKNDAYVRFTQLRKKRKKKADLRVK